VVGGTLPPVVGFLVGFLVFCFLVVGCFVVGRCVGGLLGLGRTKVGGELEVVGLLFVLSH
jgi:hypothetical protein